MTYLLFCTLSDPLMIETAAGGGRVGPHCLVDADEVAAAGEACGARGDAEGKQAWLLQYPSPWPTLPYPEPPP